MTPILHCTTRAAWDTAVAQGSYAADSLAQEGFIHLSTPAQILAVADARFRGQGGLVLLCVDAERLVPELRYENLEGGALLFPHVYGPINLDAVRQVVAFPPEADGSFRMPSGLGKWGNSEPQRDTFRRMGRTVLLYGVFGPPIGAAPFFLWDLAQSGVAQDGVAGVLVNAIYKVGLWIYVSYRLALVPALITGFLVGRLPRRWGAFWFVSGAGLIGSLVSFGWFGLRQMELPDGTVQDMLFMPLLGGFSAGTLAVAIRCVPFVGRFVRHRAPG